MLRLNIIKTPLSNMKKYIMDITYNTEYKYME